MVRPLSWAKEIIGIDKRVRFALGALANLRHVLREPKIPLKLKRKTFDACVLEMLILRIDQLPVAL